MFKSQQQKTAKSLLLTLTLTALAACSGGGGSSSNGGTGGSDNQPQPEVSIINPSVLFKSGGEVQIVGKNLKDATVGFGPQNLTPSEQTDTLIRVTLPAGSVGAKTVKLNQQTNNVVFKDFYTKIASGSASDVTCGLLPNKKVECWGSNYGNAPKPISGLTDVKDIGVGGGFYCALLTDKTVQCWGSNYYGQLGDNTNTNRDTPAFVKNSAGTGNLSNVIKLAVGSAHACVVIEGSASQSIVQCWGNNLHGQLGNGTRNNATLPVEAFRLQNNNNSIDIAAGGDHTCIILADNKVSCWGLGTSGQLGNNSSTNSHARVEVGASLKAKAIGLGASHSCAVLLDNTAKCWGEGTNGRLGDGSTTVKKVPTAVSNINNVASISAGQAHTCARLKDNKVKCWGRGYNGRLGNNSTADATTPVDVVSPNGSGLLTKVTSIVAAKRHTCATFSDKPTHCWGINSNKQLGNGRLASSKVPTPIVASNELLIARNMYDIKQVSAGAEHICAVLKDNSVKCWGKNYKGQLGTGSTSTTPVSIDAAVKAHNITNAKQVVVGRKFTCVLLTDKSISCWGGDSSNYMGELGDGNNKASLTPVKVKDINNAIQLTKGHQGICALLEDGTVKCWGNNEYAQIGDGTTTNALEPKVVTGLSNVTQISSSDWHSCALLKDKTVKCWGANNQGQTGITVANTTAQCGTNVPCIKTPVQVPNLSNVSQISLASGAYSCARLENKTIKCWGFNYWGQLGNNSTTNSASPVVVSGINNARKLVTGAAHSCALLEDNSVKCWGRNNARQLGDGTSINRKVPVKMTRVKGKVDDIFLGYDKTLLIHSSLVVSMGG